MCSDAKANMGLNVNVSVIIPCYNCELTIVRAVDSILKQSSLPLEIVLVDDCSTDSTLQLLMYIKSSVDQIPVVVVALSENKGAANARNVGWDLAKGDYIALLDADDAWHKDKLSLQYSFMTNNLEVFVSGHSVDLTGYFSNFDIKKVGAMFVGKYDILIRNLLPTPTLMFKNTNNFRFDPDMRRVDDHLFLMQIILDGNIAVKLDACLCFVFKPMYGASGLSGDIYKMERSELLAYNKIYKSERINYFLYIFLCFFSIVKFVRRFIIVSFRWR
jgi:glycosyltransferase involved in cell wall biosynthesis